MSASTDIAAPDRTLLGVSLIVGSVTVMALADAVVKLMSADVSIWQLFALRSLAALPILLAIRAVAGGRLAPVAPFWALLRSVLLVLCWIAFYASLPVLDLSVAAVGFYAAPVMIALLSAPLLGERVGARRWAGVGLGFLGALAIIRPGAGSVDWFALLPLLAAFLYALAMVLTRAKCRAEPALALTLQLHLTFIAAGLIGLAAVALAGPADALRAAYPFLVGGWAPVGAQEVGLMALLGLFGAIYGFGTAMAYQVAPPPIVATFDYSYLVSAAIWGAVFFAERPDGPTLAGMALIAGAGLLVAAPGRRPR